MKIKGVLAALLLVGISVSAAEYRDFMSADGKAIRGKIIKFEGKTGMVMIERDNRKRATVPISVFSGDDQAYIREWSASQAFLSNSLLTIRCNDIEKEKWKKEETQDVRYTDGSVEEDFVNNVIKSEKIAYQVKFKNMGSAQLQNISMDYIVYYEQSEMVWEKKPEVKQLMLKGKADVPALRVKSDIMVETKSVTIHEDDINPVPQLNGDQRRPGKGKVHGMRVRLYMEKPDGSKVMREFSSPDTLSDKKYPWSV